MTPKFLRGYLQVFRDKGLKEGIKAVGLPVAIGMFMFFLIKGCGTLHSSTVFDCERCIQWINSF